MKNTHRREVRRHGAVLLEVIVAMTILATSGVAIVFMARQASTSVQVAHDRENEMRMASSFMHAAALWTREDLDRRLGTRSQGPWLMDIQRPERPIYMIALTDSLSGRVLLRTALFRPDSTATSPGDR